ncbi:unnamed protein product [Lupinus luteus]|uniref:Uncharacterized protein n=1 Tax=Lupinus luteus TaxID=3873 RepID=A0AAV1XYY3_LUPLU
MGDDAVAAFGTTILDDGTTLMDFDYMNELLFDGCWLETTAEESDFPLFDSSSFSWNVFENEHESQEALFSAQDNISNVDVSSNKQYQSEIQSLEDTPEGFTRWWIAPTLNNPGPSYSVMEKLMKALKCIHDLNRKKDKLIQIWVPVNRGGKQILTTNDHQFCLGTRSTNLAKYREDVDLRSSKLSSIQDFKACHKSYEAVLPEIREVFRSACEMHKLPLAQTWIPCIQQGKEGCRHSEDNYLHCISPVEHACYVNDPSIRAFHDACSEHHLLKGQGVAGGAYLTNQPCFSSDITSLSKTDYPLSHHARMFGLHAAVAIRLRSIHDSTDDYVLEFFLPVNCIDSEEHKKMLTSLSMIIQRVCHSLRVITDDELESETNILVDEVKALADSRSRGTVICTEVLQDDMAASLDTEEKSKGGKFSDPRQQQDLKGISKTGEKNRTKDDKTITLQILQQHFAGSLKDAAKNIGVCTTTLKRICRRHGIKRWPSRKIKKVGHSLQKLQLVIDSVQGASGVCQIDSFYSNFPDLLSPDLSGTAMLSALKQSDNTNSLSPEDFLKSPSSSCNQSSISSHPCSTMSEQQYHTTSVVEGNKDSLVVEDYANIALKRIRNEAELKSLVSQDNKEKFLPISLSQETLGEQQHSKANGNATKKEDSYRVKLTYGDEKSRFRMPKTWSYENLLQDIGMRFNIRNMSKFDVKYLDDDFEWVLLTCDADLEECIDVCQTSENRTIKLALQVSNLGMRSSLQFT